MQGPVSRASSPLLTLPLVPGVDEQGTSTGASVRQGPAVLPLPSSLALLLSPTSLRHWRCHAILATTAKPALITTGQHAGSPNQPTPTHAALHPETSPASPPYYALDWQAISCWVLSLQLCGRSAGGPCAPEPRVCTEYPAADAAGGFNPGGGPGGGAAPEEVAQPALRGLAVLSLAPPALEHCRVAEARLGRWGGPSPPQTLRPRACPPAGRARHGEGW